VSVVVSSNGFVENELRCLKRIVFRIHTDILYERAVSLEQF